MLIQNYDIKIKVKLSQYSDGGYSPESIDYDLEMAFEKFIYEEDCFLFIHSPA